MNSVYRVAAVIHPVANIGVSCSEAKFSLKILIFCVRDTKTCLFMSAAGPWRRWFWVDLRPRSYSLGAGEIFASLRDVYHAEVQRLHIREFIDTSIIH